MVSRPTNRLGWAVLQLQKKYPQATRFPSSTRSMLPCLCRHSFAANRVLGFATSISTTAAQTPPRWTTMPWRSVGMLMGPEMEVRNHFEEKHGIKCALSIIKYSCSWIWGWESKSATYFHFHTACEKSMVLLFLKLVKIQLRVAQCFKNSFRGQDWPITFYSQMVSQGCNSTLWKVEAALALQIHKARSEMGSWQIY